MDYAATQPNAPKRKPQPGDPDYQGGDTFAGDNGMSNPPEPPGVPAPSGNGDNFAGARPAPVPSPLEPWPNATPAPPQPMAGPAPTGPIGDFGPGGAPGWEHGNTTPNPPSPMAPAPAGLPLGVTDAGNGMVTLPNGATVPTNHPLYQQLLQGQGGGAAPTTPGAPAGPAAPMLQTTFKDALLKQFGQTPDQVSADSPEIKGSITANRLAEQRAFERNRAMLAERSARNGTGGDTSGAFESGLEGLAQDRGGREASFEGNAVADLAKQRQQTIMQALTLGGQYLSDQDRMGLQKELATLDAQIRREGIQQQGALGQGDLALRGRLGEGQLNLGLMQALMQNDQFGKGLSANLGMFNQNALLNALGGLG